MTLTDQCSADLAFTHHPFVANISPTHPPELHMRVHNVCTPIEIIISQLTSNLNSPRIESSLTVYSLQVNCTQSAHICCACDPTILIGHHSELLAIPRILTNCSKLTSLGSLGTRFYLHCMFAHSRGRFSVTTHVSGDKTINPSLHDQVPVSL